MNPLIPLFVVIPLAGAFLIMILGRFLSEFNKYLHFSYSSVPCCIQFLFPFHNRGKYISSIKSEAGNQ